jgi:histidyl-tRNA synthetase
MKDLYGPDMAKYSYVIKNASKVAKVYGYSMISTPIVEYTEVFQRSIGDDTDVVSKEMYTFMDKGGELITLRPEGTAGIMRAIATGSLAQRMPVKLMYYGEMFRYDRPQKGRYRQFHQLGAEHVGEKSPYTDVMTILLTSDILSSLKIQDCKIMINSLGDDETRKEYVDAVVQYLSQHEGRLSADSKARLRKNPLRILDSKDATDIEICFAAPRLKSCFTSEAGRYFDKVCELLERSNQRYEIDNFLVRGLDYYSHTVFEIKSPHERDSIGGGGRYDKLLKTLGGPDVSGIGFAFGVERLMQLVKDDSLPPRTKKAAVIPVSEKENDAAMAICVQLHNYGIVTEFFHIGTMGKKMQTADKMGCDLALIIGENECAGDYITVKYMYDDINKKKEQTIDKNKMVEFLKYNL